MESINEQNIKSNEVEPQDDYDRWLGSLALQNAEQWEQEHGI